MYKYAYHHTCSDVKGWEGGGVRGCDIRESSMHLLQNLSKISVPSTASGDGEGEVFI